MTTSKDLEVGMSVMGALNMALEAFYLSGGPRLHVVIVCAIQNDPQKAIIVASGLPPDLTVTMLQTAASKAEENPEAWVEREGQ